MMSGSSIIRELADIIDNFSPVEGVNATLIPGVNILRYSAPSAPTPTVYEPCLCVVAQGEKRAMLEDEVFFYTPSQYLVASVDLPVTGQVTRASRAEPYLCLQLKIDALVVNDIMVQSGLQMNASDVSHRGLYVDHLDEGLLESVMRLARLLNTPQDIPVLDPLIKREIYYRLLMGELGEVVRQIATTGSNMHRIARVIRILKSDFSHSISVDDMAGWAGMSVSSFHQHFKSVTAMSPLQYQKQLRLLEARRLMLAQMADAASASFQVGYESPSQFSREYARMFGAPPMTDIKRLRAEGAIVS